MAHSISYTCYCGLSDLLHFLISQIVRLRDKAYLSKIFNIHQILSASTDTDNIGNMLSELPVIN